MKTSKFISIVLVTVLAVVYAFGSITFAAGSDDVNSAADALTLELLTAESSYAVTKPLDISSSGIKSLCEEYGANITWSTDDTDVLAISKNSVSLTRGETDKEVTLTATITKDGAEATKELTFTVPSKNAFVFESESFAYPEKEGQYINNIGSRWGKSGNDSYYNAVLKKHNGNYAMEANLVKQNDNAQTPTTCFSLSEMPDSQQVTIEFTMEFAEPATAPNTLHYNVLFCVADNPRPWYDYITYLDFERDNRRGIVYHRPAASGTASALVTNLPYATNKKARIKYDFHFGENPYYDVYLDGEKVYSNAQLLGSTTQISEVHFNIQRFGKEGRFYVDDLTVTAPVEGVEVPSLIPSSVGALEVDYSNGFFNITAEYDKDNYIMYKSGNTQNDNAHFDHHGVWLKSKTSGTETLLLERISADETAPPMINNAYLGGNHGLMGPIITVSNHGMTYNDIGTYWQAGNNGGNWTLVKIVDANHLQFIGDDWASGTNAFNNDPTIRNNGGAYQQSGTLTSLDGTGEVLNFTAQSPSQQIFPAFTDKVQKVYTVTGGVEQEVTDLSTLKSARCDRLILDESYIITDPTQMAPRLRANRPLGGYVEAPDIACGDPVLRYHQTITFMEDGTVITEFDHEFLKDVNSFVYYGYQYYMKNNYGGGVKRYMPDTKPFTAESAVYSSRDGFTKGSSKTFDFSSPHQVISGTYFDYPYNAQPDKSQLWADTSKAPNRVVDYMMNSDGTTRMGFANGFLPIYDGKNDVRVNDTSKTFYFYGSVKAYPIFTSRGATKAGTTFHGVSYKKHDNTAKASENVQAYSVMYGDEVYYYIDFLADSENTSIKLPDNFDTDTAMCIDMTGAPEYEISGNTVTVSGSKKDYIVLKSDAVSKDSAVINKTFYNVVNGKIQADIANPASASLNATAVAVCYDKNGRMLKVKSLDAPIAGGKAEILTFDEDFSQGSYCRVFLFEKDSAEPLCINGYSEIN